MNSLRGRTMNKRYAVATFFLGIAACATTVPQPPETIAQAGDSASNSNSTKAVDEIEIADIPEIPKRTDVPVRDDVICQMERRTGTNRARRVCRTRSQNAKSAREGKKAFEDLRKSQTGYP
jgi:hypothetical protein